MNERPMAADPTLTDADLLEADADLVESHVKWQEYQRDGRARRCPTRMHAAVPPPTSGAPMAGAPDPRDEMSGLEEVKRIAQEKVTAKQEVRNKIRELLGLDNDASEVDVLEEIIRLKERKQPKSDWPPIIRDADTASGIASGSLDPYGKPYKRTWYNPSDG